jgi:hypothetical protein
MTAPNGQGFPDWQRNAPAANTIYARLNETIVADKNLGPFWVAYYPAININWLSSGGRALLRMLYFADQAMTQFVQEVRYTIDNFGLMSLSVPIRGPWCRCVISLGGASFNYQLFLSGVQQTGINLQFAPGNVLVQSGITTILAGATQTFNPGVTWPGRAHLTMSQLVGAWHGEINTIDTVGAKTRMFSYDSNGGAQMREMVILPNCPFDVTLTNTSGAGSQCQVYLTADPSTPYGG